MPASSEGAALSLTVYDAQGRRVRSLWNGAARTGPQSVAWDGSDDNGARVGSGVYFYRLAVAGEQLIRKMVLSR